MTLLSVKPIVTPLLFLTDKEPLVESSESLARNCPAVLITPEESTRDCVLVAVPAKTKSESTTLNPFCTFPVKLGIVSMFCGSNEILLQSPTSVPPTQYFIIVLLVPVASSTVTTCGPERPWKAL